MTPSNVVVYVTREHPETGADQLVVLGGPTPIVPGGQVDPEEPIEAAARRSVLEKTGIEIRPVRVLGSAGASRFLQAAPIGPTAGEWEHRQVRWRWAEIRPDLELSGDHGLYLGALFRQRVVAYVTREREGRIELLTIEHEQYPDEGVQVPAGRIELGESLEDGLRRELAEETGLEHFRIVQELPGFESEYESFCENHAFHVVAGEETPKTWRHEVHGEGADAGLVYICRWLPLTADLPLWNRRDPMLRHLPYSQV